MTIKLTAPIFVAGVYQATGTQLTLAADKEAELVNRGVATYVSRTLAPGENLIQAMLSTDASGNKSLIDPSTGILYPINKGHVTLVRAAATAPINYNVSTGITFDTFYDNGTPFQNADIWNGTTDTDALIIPPGVSHVKFTANLGIPTTFVPTAPDLAASIRLTVQENYVTIPVVTPALHIMFIPPTYDTTGHLGIASPWIPTAPGNKYNLVLKHEANAAIVFAGGLACYLNAEFK
jgi:hypothetical protein